eukprot:364328-Chlamydomonas_euryale.AAC.2
MHRLFAHLQFRAEGRRCRRRCAVHTRQDVCREVRRDHKPSAAHGAAAATGVAVSGLHGCDDGQCGEHAARNDECTRTANAAEKGGLALLPPTPRNDECAWTVSAATQGRLAIPVPCLHVRPVPWLRHMPADHSAPSPSSCLPAPPLVTWHWPSVNMALCEPGPVEGGPVSWPVQLPAVPVLLPAASCP